MAGPISEKSCNPAIQKKADVQRLVILGMLFKSNSFILLDTVTGYMFLNTLNLEAIMHKSTNRVLANF